MKRLGRWVMRHRTVGPLLHRLIHRRMPRHRYARRACLLCRAVWAALPPSTLAEINRGLADLDAGRWFVYYPETGESKPNPAWPKDGPQPGDAAIEPIDTYRRRGQL